MLDLEVVSADERISRHVYHPHFSDETFPAAETEGLPMPSVSGELP